MLGTYIVFKFKKPDPSGYLVNYAYDTFKYWIFYASQTSYSQLFF